jgi:hypothetical protein
MQSQLTRSLPWEEQSGAFVMAPRFRSLTTRQRSRPVTSAKKKGKSGPVRLRGGLIMTAAAAAAAASAAAASAAAAAASAAPPETLMSTQPPLNSLHYSCTPAGVWQWACPPAWARRHQQL